MDINHNAVFPGWKPKQENLEDQQHEGLDQFFCLRVHRHAHSNPFRRNKFLNLHTKKNATFVRKVLHF
jgi:hypothetical protein